MTRHRVGAWVLTAFDSSREDPREYLKTTFDGLTLHIRPGQNEACNTIAVFVENEADAEKVQLSVNRFLSAMAWKDVEKYVTLGTAVSRARWEEKDKPRFNMSEGRVLRYKTIDPFDFEPPGTKTKTSTRPLPRRLEQQSSLLPVDEFLQDREHWIQRSERPDEVDQRQFD
jgi:hypothetical protein